MYVFIVFGDFLGVDVVIVINVLLVWFYCIVYIVGYGEFEL